MRGKDVDGSRPSSLFESRLNGLDQDALKRVARSIGITLSQTEDLLPIEVQVRKELEKFGAGETVDDKALLFWRTARIVQTRSLVPHAHTEGDTLFTAAVWNLLTQVNIRTTTGRTTPAQLAREAEEALRHRQRLQRQRITGGEPRGSTTTAAIPRQMQQVTSPKVFPRASPKDCSAVAEAPVPPAATRLRRPAAAPASTTAAPTACSASSGPPSSTGALSADPPARTL